MPPKPICPKHPKYLGKKRPKNSCPRCQKVYDYMHGILDPKKMKKMDHEMMAPNLTPCKKHPKYKGIQKPKNGCPDCLNYYNAKHNIVDLDKIKIEEDEGKIVKTVNKSLWTLKKPGTFDTKFSSGHFICNRPALYDMRKKGENICGCCSFFITRRKTDLFFKCTFCGREYRAEIDGGILKYTQQPIRQKRQKNFDINSIEILQTKTVSKKISKFKKKKKKNT